MNTNDRVTRWLAGIFIVVFGAAAVFFVFRYSQAVWMTWQARHWVAVPAQVDHWDMKSRTTTDSDGTTTTHQVVAQYRYSWKGLDYAGTRVGFTDSSDNFSGDFRARAVEALRNPPSGQVVAWVNPDRPARAVLVRSLPWEQTLFSAVFLIFPCGIATFALIAGIDLLRMRLFNAPDSPAPIGSIWALLHGLTAVPIIALAPPGALGFGSWLLLGLLLCIGGFGMTGLAGRVLPTARMAGA